MSAIATAAFLASAVPATAHGEIAESKCITEGLRPIPVSLRASVFSREGGRVNSPRVTVVWSGSPLPKACGAHVSVSFDVRLRFQNVGGRPFDLGGGPGGWQVFWSGYGQVHRAHKVYGGPDFIARIGCITRSRGQVRYRVISTDGEVLAERVQAVPVQRPPCDKAPGRAMNRVVAEAFTKNAWLWGSGRFPRD